MEEHGLCALAPVLIGKARSAPQRCKFICGVPSGWPGKYHSSRYFQRVELFGIHGDADSLHVCAPT